MTTSTPSDMHSNNSSNVALTELERAEVEERTQKAMQDMQRLVESANATILESTSGDAGDESSDSDSDSDSENENVRRPTKTKSNTRTNPNKPFRSKSQSKVAPTPASTPSAPQQQSKTYGSIPAISQYDKEVEPLVTPIPLLNAHKSCLTRIVEILGL